MTNQTTKELMLKALMILKPASEAATIDRINELAHDYGLDMHESISLGNEVLEDYRQYAKETFQVTL